MVSWFPLMGCYNFLKVMGVWGTCQDILGCDGTTLLGKKSIKQDSDPQVCLVHHTQGVPVLCDKLWVEVRWDGGCATWCELCKY